MTEVEKFEAGKFRHGQSGNPAGRPKGIPSGRARALGALDRIVGKDENMAVLEAAIEETLRKRPLWFFVNVIMPLLPKESRGMLETGDRVVEWRSLLSTYGDGAQPKGDGGG